MTRRWLALAATVAFTLAACSASTVPGSVRPSAGASVVATGGSAFLSPRPPPSAAPSAPSAGPSSVAVASPTLLSRDQAIAIARRFAIGASANWIVQTAAGPYRQFNPMANAKVSPPPPDRWVWQVTFDSGQTTTAFVMLDYYTGAFIETGTAFP